MTKVIRTVTLDHDLVQEFKLTCTKDKLSTVLNELLGNYLNVNDRQSEPVDELERQRKMILEQKTKLDAQLLTVRTKLQKYNDESQKVSAHKEKEWQDYKQLWKKDTREDFEAWYEQQTWNIE